MATHYETLDIDTDASPEESELSVPILGLRSLAHRLPPVLPSPVLSQHLGWHRTSRLTYIPSPMFSSPKSLQESRFEAAPRQAPQPKVSRTTKRP